MFSRSIINDSRSVNDNSRVVKMTIVIDAPRFGIIVMALELRFMIVIF